MKLKRAGSWGQISARGLSFSGCVAMVQWLRSDAASCSDAAKLKAAHKLSFADVFVAASAHRPGHNPSILILTFVESNLQSNPIQSCKPERLT